MKRALVFSGGGAKGSYQIGVWKALRKLHIIIDIVTGCSIGSINAALFAENKYHIAKKMWLKITTDDLFTKDETKVFKTLGLKFDKAKEYLDRLIDESKIRKSKIDYGLVTFNYKKRTPKILTKQEIPEGKLVDYILASSTFYPFIEKKKIDDDYYIDGGFYDNMPINLAVDMGATEVIAIDLKNIGIKRKTKNKEIPVTVIEYNLNDYGTLVFTKEKAKERIKLGYNDTMKKFNKLDGNTYTFKYNSLSKNYNKIKEYYIDLLKVIFLSNDSKLIKEIFKITKYNTLFTNIKQNKDISNYILDSIEYLGKTFDIDKTKIYNIDNFNRLLIKKVKELNYLKVGTKLKGKMLIGYIYNKYMESENKENVYRELFNLALVFNKDFLSAVCLISISKKYKLTFQAEDVYNNIYKFLNNNEN